MLALHIYEKVQNPGHVDQCFVHVHPSVSVLANADMLGMINSVQNCEIFNAPPFKP